MLVNVNAGTVSLFSDDGLLVSLPFEPLDEKAMLLQAQYHLFLRHHRYRRELVCRRCRETMIADNGVHDEDQAWEVLARCACRAMYGKVAMSHVPLSAARAESTAGTLSPDEIATIVAYERRFLAANGIAEKLYCDTCYAVGQHDGCRVSVTENGFSGIVRIQCRCRTIEHKGMTH